MPESPEVSKMRDGLLSIITQNSRKIINIEFFGRYKINKPKNYEMLMGALESDFTIDDIKVKGKFMYWDLSQVLEDGSSLKWIFFVTHGMSGGWTLDEAKHPMMLIVLENGKKIILNDPRHFATIHILSPFDDVSPEKQLIKKLKTLGPDLLREVSQNVDEVIKRFKRKKHLNVCQALMDQSIIAGVGNYLKAETLWASSISPHRTISELSSKELNDLIVNVAEIAKSSYLAGGATLRTYSDIEGDSGNAQFLLQCYGRKFDKDNNEIIKEETLDKRTTWWAPNRQK